MKTTFMQSSEADEQSALFKWAAWQSIPELSLLFAIPNGGKRDIITATHLKAQGVKSGVPDIFLPVARGIYHGLFIEMKVKKNKPTGNQYAWINDLIIQGYCVKVCYGWFEASEVIIKYLKRGKL